jgi:flagellar secretion chaperone FliS
MNSHESVSAYHQSTGFGATAVGQIIALYDTILRDLRQANSAIESGEIEQRVNSSNHALIVIGELQSVLDFERGGTSARILDSFYNVSRVMITEASILSSREKFKELIAMFARLRAAWSVAERVVAPSEPPDRLRISTNSEPVNPQRHAVTSGNSEETGHGGWHG